MSEMLCVNKKTKVLVYGASGHALVVAEIINQSKSYEIAGFLDDINAHHYGMSLCGSYILGGKECLDEFLSKGISSIIVAIGDCSVRRRISLEVKSRGFSLITCIHPSAVIASDVLIGEGTVIAAGAVISVGAKLGNAVIVNTAATIDHECNISDGVHIGPGVSMGGLVTIGEMAWVGVGAAISDRISIGKCSIIGAGSVVVKDIDDGVVAFGCPAKAIRKVDESSE